MDKAYIMKGDGLIKEVMKGKMKASGKHSQDLNMKPFSDGSNMNHPPTKATNLSH